MPEHGLRRGAGRDARRGFIARGLAAASLCLNLPLAGAATIVAVRVWPSRDYTRVTLELDAPLQHTLTVVSDPPRVVVDLEGVDLDTTLRELVAKVRSDDPYIQQVRVGQFKPRVVRLVFDVRTEVSPQLFPSAPVANYRHRLVLDLYPRVAADPLQSLLAEMQAREDPIAALLRDRERTRAPATAARGEPEGSPDAAGAGSPAAGGPDAAASGLPQASPDVPPGRTADAAASTRARAAAGAKARKPIVSRLVTIAIDPGHGGEDPGAIGGNGTREKDVVLAIGQLLRERINAEPNMRAYMTRDADFFVPLAVRVAKARRVLSDLFVSIHADAFVNPHARGASVYVLSEARASSGAARWLANRENQSDLVGGVSLARHDRHLAQLLVELSTSAQIRDSSNLGRIVLGQLGTIGELHRPAIEKAGFAVLKAPDIPSILVETAFISNPAEERRLGDRGYQERIADAIFAGLRHYLIRYPPAARSAPT